MCQFFFETNYLITMLYFKFSAIAEFNGSTHINEQKSRVTETKFFSGALQKKWKPKYIYCIKYCDVFDFIINNK